jgi:hypothetical protein
MGRTAKRAAASESSKRRDYRTQDMARSTLIAKKLAKVAPHEDPAHIAGAIAIFATETIRRSAKTLIEARAYLEGLRAGIDGLLKNAFVDDARESKD